MCFNYKNKSYFSRILSSQYKEALKVKYIPVSEDK